jgi:uridylate kinase
MAYERVLLKLSGEALGDPSTGHGIDPAQVDGIAGGTSSAAPSSASSARRARTRTTWGCWAP